MTFGARLVTFRLRRQKIGAYPPQMGGEKNGI